MTLILISDFMQDEIYLNEEVKFYKNFDRVVLFTVKGHVYSNNRLTIPDYIEVGDLDIQYGSIFDKAKCLFRGIFNKESLSELSYLIKSRKLSLNSIKSYALFSAKTYLIYKKIEKKLNELSIDTSDPIVFYSYRVGFSSLACCKLKKIYYKSKVVSRAHAQDIFEFRNKDYYLPYRSYVYNNLNEIYCISNDGMNYLSNNYKELKNKLFIYRLGTKNISINKNINNKKFIILTCSRIVKIKRLHILAETLKNIKDIDITWVHYGDGDSDYLRFIKEILKKCGPNIKVKFKGFVNNDDYLKKISIEPYSVFINISESEGLPVSIMEAESAGLPIIATDVGGTSEAVIDNYNGILLDKDFTTNDLENSILKFSSMDINEFNEFRNNSRSIWESKFKLSENYKVFIEHIKELE